MANAAQLNLKLGIDVSSLSRELGKVESRMTKFGSQMQNIGSTMTQSITLPLLGVGAASLKAFADMEKLENGLIAIMGTSEGAKEELDKLRKVAENPGLALPQVVKASASLQSTGLSADFARETIVQFGNAVARAGEGAEVFDRVTFALSQISSATKITQEDLNQLKEALPEFGNVIKKEFGETTAEGLRNLNISNQEFIQRTVEALSKLERAKGGLANAFDNLKDNVTASLAELGKTINESLKVEEAFAKVSEKLNAFIQGFKSLKPEVQSFIVYFGLAVAAIGPAVFIIGKLISTYGALAGISKKVVDGIGKINDAIKFLAANPQILIITASIAALGAIALYVYDNWNAFKDNFINIWINIKNSIGEYIAIILSKVNNLQKGLGLKLFNLEGLTSYQKEQRIVATEFKTIGETVDSLKGKLSSLFTVDAKGKQNASSIIDDEKTDDTKNPLADKKIDKKLFNFDEFKTLTELKKAKEEIDKAVINEITPKTREQLGLKEGELSLLSMKNAANDVLAFGEKLKNNPPNMAKPFSDADAAAAKLDEKINRLSLSLIDLNTGLNSIVTGALNDLSFAIGEQLGNALSGAGFNIKAFLLPIADAVISFGKLAIAVGIAATGIKAALESLNPVIAIAGGIALVALGTLVKNSLSAPKLAEGGLAYGPTMATVGDNRNARVDPEVIAPLSKLKSMMGDMGVGGTLETRISGNDLIILLNRSQKGLSRIQ
jgi:tape measure domain-containing protein